ncbi:MULTISPECIES: tRNA (adenosine(37)-N6)-dimethylallyltransferase MiaA [Oleiagrimonas]|nr:MULTISPECIES: tRNA (adenosine(37)-N6)-dimethylallyltransferase MiaA [Oleiagrimonas]RAP59754.1 tRNA (adenosine(37)-N6)-dimethylallyltransferase MiaA [Oleiagrimonas sp. MCCC 1A03011]
MSATDTRPLAIFLMGPTATGKTDLACALSDEFPLSLISVDSALVYRGLDIGSAKPDAATLRRYPHALIDIRDPAQPYSAADFREDALLAMREATEQGRVPLLVGGTGLYFRALQHGLSPLPEADPGIRARLQAEAEREGWPALHARLRALDPQAAARIGPQDAQRLSRALEVIELSGQPLSTLQQGPSAPHFPWRVLKLALLPVDRTRLHARIAARVDGMLEAGLIEEVRCLRARGDLQPELPAIRAVGYRQTWQYLDSELPREELAERIVFATRQLAKRQTTWLRREFDARCLDPDRQDVLAEARRSVHRFLAHAGTG